MLFAERHRKLGRHGSRAHERSEDLLTSTFVQLLRYIPLEEGLLAVLSRVRSATPDGGLDKRPTWLPQKVSSVVYECWKRVGASEPDVVVTLFEGVRKLGRIVIEVKLDSAKSGEDGEDIAVEIPRDQLARYWRGLNDGNVHALGVIYLTSQASPPVVELASSLRSAPGDWLGWLSWGDVWTALRRSMHLAARDLADILQAKQLSHFRGFEPESLLPALGTSTFGVWKK